MNNDSLHSDIKIQKGDYFVKTGQPNFRIGQVINGVLRGYTTNNDGDEITTHFFMEGNIISGNYIPNIPATMNIQALEDCLISAANYQSVFSHINTDSHLTNVILKKFQKLNKQNNSRLVMMIDGDSLAKYKWFMQEYPNLLNRIPHYFVASFLGMTPTQLSRARKKISQHM